MINQVERMVGIKLWYLKQIPFPSIFFACFVSVMNRRCDTCSTLFNINEMVNLKYLHISILLSVLMAWAKNWMNCYSLYKKFGTKFG